VLRQDSLIDVYGDKRVMITGGLGFIGSNLARRLTALKARVLIVDALLPQCGGNLFNIHDISERVTVNTADIRDPAEMNALVRGQDFIFNLAGQVSHIDSMEDPFTDLDINCRSQLTLMEACRRHNPEVTIVFAGTRQQYGKPVRLPVDETHRQQPIDVNGINKMAGECYHLLYHNVYGIKASSLRLTNTYGPGLLMKHGRQGFISVFIRRVIDGQPLEIYGDGRQVRDFNFVDDVVDAFLLAAASRDCPGHTYNLGGDEPMSLLAFAKLLLEVAGEGSYRITPFPGHLHRIDIGDYIGDYGRINRLLGWRYRTSLHEGLRKTLDYYRRHKQHYW
jgi:UDP-glucose 4-epimerase